MRYIRTCDGSAKSERAGCGGCVSVVHCRLMSQACLLLSVPFLCAAVRHTALQVALVALGESLRVRERILHPFNKELLRTLRLVVIGKLVQSFGYYRYVATASWVFRHATKHHSATNVPRFCPDNFERPLSLSLPTAPACQQVYICRFVIYVACGQLRHKLLRYNAAEIDTRRPIGCEVMLLVTIYIAVFPGQLCCELLLNH